MPGLFRPEGDPVVPLGGAPARGAAGTGSVRVSRSRGADIDGGAGAGTGAVGDLVRARRLAAGLTQQELADRVGTSLAAVRDLEQGRTARPRPATLRRLAGVLDLEPMSASASVTGDGGRRAPGESTALRVAVLGPLDVSLGEAPVLLNARQRLLLGLLALTPERPVERDAIVRTLWPDGAPPNADRLVRSTVYRLRHVLEPGRPARARGGALAATPAGYQLRLDAGRLDLLAWRRATQDARDARDRGAPDEASAAFHRAHALWRSGVLDGIPALADHPAVIALERERVAAVLEHARVASLLGTDGDLLPRLHEISHGHPYHEVAHARLMIALAGNGMQAAALEVYGAIRRRLAEDLGIDPCAELADAHRQVLRQEFATAVPGAVPVTVAASAPDGDVEAAPAVRQLPGDIAEFTGRARELRRIAALARARGRAMRVVVVDGMAGVGKTRLAVHAAHLLAEEFPDGQVHVDLHGFTADRAPVHTATRLHTVLRTLGVPAGSIPHGVDAMAATYRDWLAGRRVLVLLDNAASEAQVAPLLPGDPAALVFVTSRRRLAIDGARGLTLDVPAPTEARALLARLIGARRAAAESRACGDLVEALGRLPLAITLAARRLAGRPDGTVTELVARLASGTCRLEGLAAAGDQVETVLAPSYLALDADLRRALRLLALHPGATSDVESAAALLGTGPRDAQRVLDALADDSVLAHAGSGRYALHVLLREHALRRGEDDGDPGERRDAVERLGRWYVDAARVAVGAGTSAWCAQEWRVLCEAADLAARHDLRSLSGALRRLCAACRDLAGGNRTVVARGGWARDPGFVTSS